MAHVANCPQCNQELLVPDETDRESWAKCPECRAFFQINQAAARELPALLLVESHSPLAESPPAGDADSGFTVSDDIMDDPPQGMPAAEAHAQTVADEPPAFAGSPAPSEAIDDWFRSAKTVADSPPTFERVAEADDIGELGDSPAEADIPVEELVEETPSPAAWDDSQHMEQLLAGIEKPSSPESEPTAVASPSPPPPGVYSDHIATSVSDLPMFSKRANGKSRRKKSLLRTFAVTAVAGVIGLALGYYALLWMLGAGGDFLQIAHYLPSVMLPAELQEKPRQLAVPPAPVPVVAKEREEFAATTPAETTEEPAEVQATFTTPQQPSAVVADPGDDRYGTGEPAAFAAEEPVALDGRSAPPPADSTTPAPVSRPASAPTFTAEQLSASLQEAEQAQPALIAGKLEDGREVQRAKANSYQLLAELAQRATFADPYPNPESVAASLQAAEKLFRTTLSDAPTRGEVAKIVPKWIASPHRAHGGVFFAANLSGGTPMGSVVEYGATLDSGQALPVLIPSYVDSGVADSSRPLGVVGWIVDRPAEQIDGYTGQSPQAVWVGRLITLE